MVKRNTSYAVNFHCFTDDFSGLDADILSKPIPSVKVIPNGCFRRETAFFSPNLGGLKGERVFYFDLDMLMVGNLDSLFSYPKDDQFYIIKDWASKGDQVGQGSCFSWVISDDYNDITVDYEKNKLAIDQKYGTASQEYLSDKIIEKQGVLRLAKDWFQSFRFHCLPHPYCVTSRFQIEKEELKVIVFMATQTQKKHPRAGGRTKKSIDGKFGKKSINIAAQHHG